MNTSSSSFIKEGSNSQGIVKPYNSFLPLSPTLLASEQQQSKVRLINLFVYLQLITNVITIIIK
jgi:hypothetical protein